MDDWWTRAAGDREILDPTLYREATVTGIQGMAALPIVDPETIVRQPLLPARCAKGESVVPTPASGREAAGRD